MNRNLTPYEIKILELKAKNWSYSLEIVNGLIALGNGFENDGITAFLPYELLMDDHISLITKYHVLVNKPVETTNEQHKLTQQEYEILRRLLVQDNNINNVTYVTILGKLGKLKV